MTNDRHISLGAMIICLNKPGFARILGVSTIRPTGSMTVDRWLVRKSPFWTGDGNGLGEHDGTLADAGFEGGRTVNVSATRRPDEGMNSAWNCRVLLL